MNEVLSIVVEKGEATKALPLAVRSKGSHKKHPTFTSDTEPAERTETSTSELKPTRRAMDGLLNCSFPRGMWPCTMAWCSRTAQIPIWGENMAVCALIWGLASWKGLVIPMNGAMITYGGF